MRGLNDRHLYSVYFAPRGVRRMTQIGQQIAERHLSPFDRLIGIVGEAGSGKSMLVKGMFPGLEMTNDDNGVNVRPLPVLSVDEDSF
ncbi:MAG: alanine-tRNA synthetase second additional domain-containing protein, partial [Clostridia bacterium]